MSLTPNEYQELANRTANANPVRSLSKFLYQPLPSVNPAQLLNAALGLAGEAGEYGDAIKKLAFHEHSITQETIVYSYKELGDICWYVALACTALGITFEDVLEKNIEKLKARYPEGFSGQASQERVE